ncbi:hypothetical protein D3C87_2143990 [compost metagenome]
MLPAPACFMCLVCSSALMSRKAGAEALNWSAWPVRTITERAPSQTMCRAT